MTPQSEIASLSGKTALVTGCNKGLGFQVARQLILSRISHLIITTRDHVKGEAAISALQADPEVVKLVSKTETPTRINWFPLELDDYNSTMSFVAKVEQGVYQLDILILCAGMLQYKFERAKTGHELLMQGNLNCYSNCLIINCLSNLLGVTSRRRQSPAHITVVGSYSMKSSIVNSARGHEKDHLIQYLDTEESYRPLHRYPDSKLMMHVYIHHFAAQTRPCEIIVNTVCPGLVFTDLSMSGPFWLRSLIWASGRVMGHRTVEDGARLIVHAATAIGEESHGKFVQNSCVDRFESSR
ncbi:unnamed protein product [Penicillium salamii]|uniref:Uncharacterized protein n=1 Tax=Penicillium salamii TaxID=1612424 RepID=A0A9W4NQH5_9EURO|nr:unnamed protein product [Penicillium salamii]CAG8053890.1 unnamed protein product [Penicillium salamii]CAG8115824.1 unnamed protein product [Penicillium salamii]CAG8259764.1 unnamed protein product [Penicillium salamii]CAG8294976.1 unnamed protein product [Penicillium salamii]